ncbi:GntR family transcriptional regulator [Opitutales bacterium]|nr:GntR family transcriptional regulator [Opitutales bacterium]
MKLSSRIQNDLGSQLMNNSLSVPLTMDGLSEHYGVSYTPIRQALDGLIEDGLIRKKENGRLELIETLKPHIYEGRLFEIEDIPDPSIAITRELIELSLSGKEIFVREEITARKHGLSRSSLRQILQRLAGEGLVLHLPRRGWQVKPFRQEDLQSFIEVREVMELKALDLARAKLCKPEAKTKLLKIKSSNKVSRNGKVKVSIDNSLHQFLLELANNTYLQDFFDRHGKYFSILFKWEGENPEAAKQAVAQHHDIIDALLDENWALAKKHLSHHLRNNHPVLQEISFEA